MGESSTRKPRKPRTYGPIQLGNVTGLAQWEIERAIDNNLLPATDADGRWPADEVDALAADRARMADIRARTGLYPDMGAMRCAEVLEEAYGREITADTVVELARQGVLPENGDYKGYPLYCGRHLETLADPKSVINLEVKAIIETAVDAGRLRTADDAATYLRIRRCDFDHLVAANWLEPASWGRSAWQRRRSDPTVPLYRTGDLDVLLTHPGIDWDAVRATPKGRPSPLAALTAKPRKVTA